MPEEPEVETKDLQETIDELQEDRKERAAEAKAAEWTRYIALTTALLAVFAAIGALQAGSLVNEAMMVQLRASDKWNEYQADRQKDHLYSVNAYALLDRGVRPGPDAPSGTPSGAGSAAGKAGAEADSPLRAASPAQRLGMYVHQIESERDKENDLKAEAQKLEEESARNMSLHEQFARAVTLIQVAVALAAIAALAKLKPVWLFSLLIGLSGIFMFATAYAAKLGW